MSALEDSETTSAAPTEEKPRRRGRPKGSKNKKKTETVETAVTSEEAAASEKETATTPRTTRTRTRRPRTSARETAESAESAESAQAAQTAASESERSGESAAQNDYSHERPTGTRQNAQRATAQRANTHAESYHQDNARKQRPRQNSTNVHDQRHQRRQHGRQNRDVQPSISLEELGKLKVAELRLRADELGIDVTGLKKKELVDAVYEASLKAEGFREVAGILDILSDGYGFLRTSGYLPGEDDVYVGLATIRRAGLRKGDYVTGQTRPARENEKYAALNKVSTINGLSIEQAANRPRFADLTPVYPDERLVMEHGAQTITARVIDLVAPIGKGQRGLIVSPPKAGKTTILKDIAASVSANNPEVHLMCLLVDERPEEVTDMQRSIHGEVISSTFDMPADNHIAVAELVIERAKRLVESGKDVVILLDSITRLARAYNLAQPASGRILSGGVDSTALYPPKRFLGAARNIEGGGSLTILASALIDTGSKMDEVIFEEFKGTGNMELKLDRNLADRRIFPAIDPVASGTRKEELLMNNQEAPLIWGVRRILANMNNTERAMDMLIKSLKQTDDNQDFLIRTAKKARSREAFDDENVEF